MALGQENESDHERGTTADQERKADATKNAREVGIGMMTITVNEAGSGKGIVIEIETETESGTENGSIVIVKKAV